MNKSLKIKKITGIAVFIGLIVALQLFSNYVTFGPVSITLALIPIVVGSIVYGPLAGFFLGFVCGVIVFLAPTTISLFWPCGIVKTFIVCSLKMGLAGLCSGFIYKLLNNKNKKISVVLASISVPIINTGLFALAAYFLFYDLLENLAPAGQNVVAYLFLSFIGFNFLIEFFVNSMLSPAVLRVVNMAGDTFGIK